MTFIVSDKYEWGGGIKLGPIVYEKREHQSPKTSLGARNIGYSMLAFAADLSSQYTKKESGHKTKNVPFKKSFKIRLFGFGLYG